MDLRTKNTSKEDRVELSLSLSLSLSLQMGFLFCRTGNKKKKRSSFSEKRNRRVPGTHSQHNSDEEDSTSSDDYQSKSKMNNPKYRRAISSPMGPTGKNVLHGQLAESIQLAELDENHTMILG